MKKVNSQERGREGEWQKYQFSYSLVEEGLLEKGNENEVVRPEVVACVRQSHVFKMLFPYT
jgi:hypothetical protein